MKIKITEFDETEKFDTRLSSENSIEQFQKEFPVGSFVWYIVGQNISFGIIKKYDIKVSIDDDVEVVNMYITLREINVYANSFCDLKLLFIMDYKFIKHATLEEIEAYETEQIKKHIEYTKENIKLAKDNLRYYKKKLRDLDKIIKNNI